MRETWEDVCKNSDLECALFNGDWQTFTRMFDLIMKDPEQYSYIIPHPGEWHWNWHILKAIYKIWCEYLLRPLSQVLKFKNLDAKCANFHYGEDFLEIVTIALADFVCELRELHPGMTYLAIMHHYKPNSHMYELLYMYLWHICPYWHTRAALKSNMPTVINQYWRYWLHAFIACCKSNHAIMTMRFLWLLRFLNPDLVKVINENCIFSFSSDKDTGIPLDGVNELV